MRRFLRSRVQGQDGECAEVTFSSRLYSPFVQPVFHPIEWVNRNNQIGVLPQGDSTQADS